VLEDSNYKLYHDRSVITDGTIHNNRLDTVILDKTINEARSMNAAIPNSHSLHSTVTEKLQKYADLKGGLIKIRQLKMADVIPLVLSTVCIIPDKLHENCLISTLLSIF
jgi:hypothetical protein